MHLHIQRFGAPPALIALVAWLQRDFWHADSAVRADWEAIKRALAAHGHDFAVYAELKEPATLL
jgi:hypothetical protein